MKASVARRVLMLLENGPYPQDNRVSQEANTLVTAGYHVSVICPRGPGQAWHEIRDGVYLYRFPAPLDAHGFLGYLLEYGYTTVVIFILSLFVGWRQGFDVVHVHKPPDTLVFIAAFYKLFGKRFVFDHHDLSPEMYYARFVGRGNRWVYQALILLERFSCDLADHVIATNQSYKTIERQRGRVPEERITIVRNGPDRSRVRSVTPDTRLRESGRAIIGYVGVMGFQDGVDYLLRALRHLAYDLGRTDFVCLLIGKGDAWASLQGLASQLGLDEYVWFPGYVPDADLIRYLSTADICVDPDPSNPFSDRSTMTKMMEYMALGKPIVAFDLPEHRVTAQDAAVYARPNDELDFAKRLAVLMDDAAQRTSMGEKGRARIETALAWSYQEKHLLEAYDRLASGLLR